MSEMPLTIWLIVMFVMTTSVAAQPVLTWEVRSSDFGCHGLYTFKFDDNHLQTFYDYLRSATTFSCEAEKTSGDLVSLFTVSPESQMAIFNTASPCYLCEIHCSWESIYCQRQTSSDSLCASNKYCRSFSNGDQTETCGPNNYVGILWKNTHYVWASIYPSNISIALCKDECFTTTTSSTTALSTTSLSTTTQKTSKEETTATTQALQASSSLKTTLAVSTDVLANQTDAFDGVQDGRDSSAIIIGVVVSLVILVAVLIAVGVIFWKRRKQAMKASSTSFSEPRTTDTGYSMALYSVNGTTSEKVTNITTEVPSYTYATVDPSTKAKSNGATNVCTTQDHDYINQDVHRENSQSNGLTINQEGADYYNVDSGQKGADAVRGPQIGSSTITDSQDSAHVYSLTEDDTATIGDTYSVIDDGTNKRKSSTNPDHSDNYNTPVNAEYASANRDMSALGNEYSTLHDPIRHIKDPYNVLLPSENVENQAVRIISTPSASTDSAPFTYFLAQPKNPPIILSKSKLLTWIYHPSSQ